MSITQISPKNSKVLFFSDLHLGLHQDSEIWHNVALKVSEWIKEVMQERRLDTIFFAGDAFHDRHEIGVNTLHVAKKFFNNLKDYNIYLIPGNHDAFLSNTVEVNSVEILETENVTVITKPTVYKVEDKTVLFCPWKCNLSDSKLPNFVDMLVGHFEIQNFKMNSFKVCEHGDNSEDLLKRSNAVVTGHFHLREHRKYDNNKYVLYLGSPYQMDFGDREQTKGLSIIDFSSEALEVEFLKNTISPSHYRLKISELINHKYENLNSIISNNFISLYVDMHIDTLTLDMLTSKLRQHNPLQFKTEFNILDNAQSEIKEVKKLSIDVETAFCEFIEHVETKATKKQVLDKCIEIYKMCQTTHE
jgi:DNA repair exonuclease SbcCD nuclease subunit